MKFAIPLITLFLVTATGALAGEREEKIIDKALKAYGGEKLMQLRSLKLADTVQHFFEMQSGHSLQGPMSMHLNRYQIELTVDLGNQRKAFKRLTNRLVGNQGANSTTTTHRVFADEQGYSIDHCSREYRPVASIEFNNADFNFDQLSDTLVIRHLALNKPFLRWTDTAVIQGVTHDVLSVTTEGEEAYYVYIEQKQGTLTRLVKIQGERTLSYDFWDHRQTQGVYWAGQVLVSASATPVYLVNNRKLDINPDTRQAFNLPAGYTLSRRPQYIDDSALSINELGKGVYLVGQNWGYTLFVDVGEHYISVGAWQMDRNAHAWAARLDLLHKTAGNRKPVAQHIVTHHHTDHMAALGDIVEQGAELLVYISDIPGVKKHLKDSAGKSRITPLQSKSDLADGRIILFDVPTSHANHNLVVYLPEQKLVFSEDIYGSSYHTQLASLSAWPDLDTYQRLDALVDRTRQLKLEVETYASSHHKRVLTRAEIDKAVQLSCAGESNWHNRLFKN